MPVTIDAEAAHLGVRAKHQTTGKDSPVVSYNLSFRLSDGGVIRIKIDPSILSEGLKGLVPEQGPGLGEMKSELGSIVIRAEDLMAHAESLTTMIQRAFKRLPDVSAPEVSVVEEPVS